VQDDGFAGLKLAQGGDVADLRGREFRAGGEVELVQGGVLFEAGVTQPLVRGPFRRL
jgi:hypothetical protein